MMITDEEIEKQNFLSWYCFYAKPKEIECAMKTHRAKMERYIEKYYSDILRVRMMNSLREKCFNGEARQLFSLEERQQ